jgi:hypothetical protein
MSTEELLHESRKKKRGSDKSVKVHKKRKQKPENEQETLREQLKGFIEIALVEYIKNSPFDRITDKVSPVKYTGISSLMVDDMLAMSTPYYGVNYAIKTMLDMLDMIALETGTIIARDFDCAKDFKTSKALHVAYQRVPMPEVDFERIKDSTDVASSVEPWIRDIVYYDREMNFIDDYKRRATPFINIVTVKLGTIVKPLLNVLMPFVAREYALSLTSDKYLVNYATLLESYQKSEQKLNAARAELKKKDSK